MPIFAGLKRDPPGGGGGGGGAAPSEKGMLRMELVTTAAGFFGLAFADCGRRLRHLPCSIRFDVRYNRVYGIAPSAEPGRLAGSVLSFSHIINPLVVRG